MQDSDKIQAVKNAKTKYFQLVKDYWDLGETIKSSDLDFKAGNSGPGVEFWKWGSSGRGRISISFSQYQLFLQGDIFCKTIFILLADV